LRDAIRGNRSQSGTQLGKAVRKIAGSYDRLIVISDEQACRFGSGAD